VGRLPVEVGGVLWRRANKQEAIAAMLGGIAAVALWRGYGHPDIDPVVPGFLASAALFVLVSLGTHPPPAHAVAEVFD